MNIQEVADKLSGLQYREESKILTREFCKELKREGIVVVYGASDDLMEFDGAIYDEFYDTVHLNSNGLIRNECEDNDCPYFKKILKDAKYYVTPLWCKDKNYAWVYKTNIPHVTFDILEEHEYYCKGIVFRLSDLV